MIQKRAQTATEYLIILAVVIIIALIVVGVLGGIPGIGSSTGSSTNSAIWQTAEIGIDSFAAVETDGSTGETIIFRNNKPSTITITGIQIGSSTSNRDTALDSINSTAVANLTKGTDARAASYTLASGQTLTLNGTGVVTCTNGDTVTRYFRINYTESTTGALFSFTNNDAGYDTTCAVS